MWPYFWSFCHKFAPPNPIPPHPLISDVVRIILASTCLNISFYHQTKLWLILTIFFLVKPPHCCFVQAGRCCDISQIVIKIHNFAVKVFQTCLTLFLITWQIITLYSKFYEFRFHCSELKLTLSTDKKRGDYKHFH